jgi:hypothetical protein
MLLCPIENREEADGRLSSGVLSRVQLGDGCVVYGLGLLFTVFLYAYELFLVRDGNSLFLVAGWYALLQAAWSK